MLALIVEAVQEGLAPKFARAGLQHRPMFCGRARGRFARTSGCTHLATAVRTPLIGALPEHANGHAAGPGLDSLDHLLVELPVILLAHVTHMWRGQYIGQAPKRMLRRQWLLAIHVQRRPGQASGGQGLHQCLFVHDRPARRIHQPCGRLHPAQRLGIHQATAAIAEYQVHSQDVGLFKQLTLADLGHSRLGRTFWVRFSLQAITRMPNTWANCATFWPMLPSPRIPRVLPYRSPPRPTCQPPSRTALASTNRLRVDAMISAQVNSGAACL